MDTPQGDLMSDFPHPAEIDWTLKGDAELWHAAQDGIAEAKAEMARRDARPQRIRKAIASSTRRFKRPQ